MIDRIIRKDAGAVVLALLLAACAKEGAPQTIDDKLAAAEQAAERAEKAQRAAEQALLSMANSGGSVSYDEAVDEATRGRNDEDDVASDADSGDDAPAATDGNVNSDGLADLPTPQG